MDLSGGLENFYERNGFFKDGEPKYVGMSNPLFSEMGVPNDKGNLRLTHAIRTLPNTIARPKVISIVIPTRNRLDLLKEALHTVVSQYYPHDEICKIFNISRLSFYNYLNKEKNKPAIQVAL